MEFSSSAVGATADIPPVGYVMDHTRIKLGEGETTFVVAKTALQRWQHFQLGWVEVSMRETAINQGVVVAVFSPGFRLWWGHACPIIFVVGGNFKFWVFHRTFSAPSRNGEVAIFGFGGHKVGGG